MEEKTRWMLATESGQGEVSMARRANMSCAGQDSVGQAVGGRGAGDKQEGGKMLVGRPARCGIEALKHKKGRWRRGRGEGEVLWCQAEVNNKKTRQERGREGKRASLPWLERASVETAQWCASWRECPRRHRSGCWHPWWWIVVVAEGRLEVWKVVRLKDGKGRSLGS